jgi:hypothetical protein
MLANRLSGTCEQHLLMMTMQSRYPSLGQSLSRLVPLTFYHLPRLAMFDIVSVCRLGPE